MAANARYSLPAGYNSHAANGAGGKPALPHIDDVLALPTDVDSKKPLKWLLEQAEMSLRQSEMSRDFNRPALALKDFIRASIITVQLVSHHKDYLMLKEGRGDLSRKHAALMTRIKQQNDIYDQLKKDIIADNKRTGVLPKSQKPVQSQSNGNHKSAAPHISSSNGHAMTASGKVKPKVHPKPQSLQGNAVSGHARSSSTNTVNVDLAARFANLRGPQTTPGQDPRIKTHQIPSLKPAGPRDMPSSPQKSEPGATHTFPSLPKMPDAIYHPARGSVSSDAGHPPATTPRGSSSRATPTPSLSNMPSPVSARQSMEYFPPVPANATGSRSLLQSSISNNEADSITAEELFQAMKQTGSVLIIDIRSRVEFDEGHIMSSSTICVEASILLRDNISAAEITESLVLSPNQEQSQFDQRNKYELVVFYDQDSEEIPRSPRSSDDMVIVSLHRALVHFNYERELKQPPKILKGGLDAWIDLMGSASLQSTSLNSSSHIPASRARSGTFQRRRSKYIRPLRADEVKVWQETLQNEEMGANQPPEYHRSTESFLRRYPPILTEQESMTSSPATEQPPRYTSLHKIDPYTDLPSPPTRPAPSVPRLSYSSLSHTSDEIDRFEEPVTRRQTVRPKNVAEQVTGDGYKLYTGLNNPHNWCYANSTVQSLLASPDFGKELSDSTWTKEYRAPKKDSEKIEPPQLMIRIMSNLFHWMSTGNLEVMKAQTLMDYSQHICKQSRSNAQFGGTQQQDAQEFMSFLMEQLHDETNSRRNLKGNAMQPNTKSQPLLYAAVQYWYNHIQYNDSIVDRHWRGLELSTVKCQDCHTKTYTFSPFEWIPAPVALGSTRQTLEQSLHQHIANNTLDDFSCDKCRRNTRAMQSISFARLPPLLCVCFRRFNYNQATGDIKKSTAPVTWDFNDFDFSPYFFENGNGRPPPGTNDHAYQGPFRYECYAVIVHAGSRTDNGHYFAYVRDQSTHDPYAWLCCNDSRVTRVRIGSGDRDDIQNEVFKSGQDRVPYLVFFRRKG
ncbi:hypothetical protein LMH87_010946 [Akanthomyces muscarius]|uniref:Ubiquitin carboxyl-terminal hydrolase 2 n=1 Tax=Akanthomyces muscarius TaxID=2231603 RepID=A0A9W8UI01_AKAMU|nr:hypothetical protein LMH87_010946 [Akanthomyces muscarius]KAJ4150183.1 hypothetical protein LMH87_010946 [Akanthomyces muscarius]